MNNNGLKIKSIEMGSLLSYQAGNRQYLDMGKAVLDNSLFSQYMLENGMTTNKTGTATNDFIMCKFSYGTEGLKKEEIRERYYVTGFTIDWTEYYDKQEELAIERMEDGKDKEKAINKRNKRLAKNTKHEIITYKMLYRSTGKAKDGHCTFCNEKLWDIANEYLTIGIDCGNKIVEMSAYKSLTCGSMLQTVNINPNNILVVKDIETSCFTKACIVKADNNNELFVDRQDSYEVTNVMWDGMCLIDENLFSTFNHHITGFAYLRSHFFKACGFRCDIQKFMRDYFGSEYETATVTNYIGEEIRVKDIKIITTENALKMWKFFSDKKVAYDYWKEQMNKYNNLFSIVKTAHKSKYGSLQRMSYQGVNSLPTTNRNELMSVCKTTIDYINTLKTDNEEFFDYLLATSNFMNNNELMVDLAKRNSDFLITDYYNQQKSLVISRLKGKAKLGKLMTIGDNLTYMGNGIALLLHSVGDDYRKDTTLAKDGLAIECFTYRFLNREMFGAYRNPQNSPNNIVLLKNVRHELIEKYFPKLGENVIMINTIGTEIQSRCNGMDEDSDFLLCSPQLADLARVCVEKYPTIVNQVPQLKGALYGNTLEDYARMDNDINKYQRGIGQSSNVAQLALSYYFDSETRDIELANVFIIMSVLAQLYIDSAKRLFEVDLNKELDRISNLPCMSKEKKFPKFFAEIKKSKVDSKEEKARIGKRTTFYECPMGIVANILDEEIKYKRVNGKLISLMDIFDRQKYTKYNANQISKIEQLILDYESKMKALAINCTKEEYEIQAEECVEEMLEELRKMNISYIAMNRVIYNAIKNQNYSILLAMYQYDKEKFLSQFIKK